MAEIQEYNLRQEELFKSGNVDLDKFDEYVEEKGSLSAADLNRNRHAQNLLPQDTSYPVSDGSSQ